MRVAARSGKELEGKWDVKKEVHPKVRVALLGAQEPAVSVPVRSSSGGE